MIADQLLVGKYVFSHKFQ